MSRASDRFFAGETPEDCLVKCAELNFQGFSCMLSFAGEHAETPETRDLSLSHYLVLGEGIKSRELKADISLKLSQFGLLASVRYRGKMEARFNSLLEKMKAEKIRVWIDGEELEHEKKTDDIIEKTFSTITPVGKIVQAYNKNSDNSLLRHMKPGMFFRVCKGAYSEPSDIARTDANDIIRSFKKSVVMLLQQGYFVQIATHDATLIQWVLQHITNGHFSADKIEIAMLLGVDMALARWACNHGLSVRIFVPFGRTAEKEAYVIRRIIERPGNIFLPIIAVFKSDPKAF